MAKESRDLRVSEEQSYVADGSGPVQDTDVFSKADSESEPVRPAHIDARPRNRATPKPGDPLSDLRRRAVAHAPSGRRTPPWLGLALGMVVAGLFGVGLVFGITTLMSEPVPEGAPAVTAPPPPSEGNAKPEPKSIQGVEVRRGLNSPGVNGSP